MTRIMKFADSDCQTAILHMFKDLKKKVIILSKQMVTLNIEIERKKKELMKILELKSIVFEVEKNSE